MDTFVHLAITVLKVPIFDRQSKRLRVQLVRSTARREPHPAQTAFRVQSIHMQINLLPLSVILAGTLQFPITRPQLVFAKVKIVHFSPLQDLVVASLGLSFTKRCQVATRIRNRIQL